MTAAQHMTTIKVSTELRDELSRRARQAGMTQAEFIERAVADLAMHDFHRAMAEWVPDEQYLAEAREWDQADLTTPAHTTTASA